MYRILIVKANEEICNSLRDIFEVRGYHVSTATDGAEAEHLCSVTLPDMLIVDITWLDQNEIRLLYNMRSAYPDLKWVVITKGADHAVAVPEGIVAQPGSTGFSALRTFEKPIIATEIVASVVGLLETQQQPGMS